jgi:hypothetical protein
VDIPLPQIVKVGLDSRHLTIRSGVE